MKNLSLIILVLSLFVSCGQGNLKRFTVGKKEFNPKFVEVDSSLLNDPKFIRFMNPEGHGSLSINMNTYGGLRLNPDPNLKLFVGAADNSARAYDFVVSTKEIGETAEVILTEADKIDSDVSKFKLKGNQVYGKMIIVRGEKKSDKSQKFEVQTYFPEKLKLLGHPELTPENPLFSISQSEGYLLKWNYDKNYTNQAVKIMIEHYRDYETANGAKVERTYFTIFTRDKGKYFIKPERLALFPKGNITISIERGDIDALNVKGLDQHIGISTSDNYNMGAILK